MKKNFNIFYYMGIILLSIKFLFDRTTLFTINIYVEMIFNSIIIILFFIKLMFQKYSKNKFLIMLLFGLLSVYTYYICDDTNLIFCFLVIFASQDIDIKKTVKISFYTILIIFLIHILSWIFSMITGIGMIDITYTITGKKRYNFYLNHPNTAAGIILWLTAEYIFLKEKHINNMNILVITIIYIVTYFFTVSRTTLVSSLLLIILLCINKLKIGKKFINIISKWIFALFAILTIGLINTYTNNYSDLIAKIDEMMSYRISLGSLAIEKYGITLLPQRADLNEIIQWASGAYRKIYIDSLYTRCFVLYGYLNILLFEIAFYKLMCRYKDSNYGIFIILFSVVAFTERYLLNPVIGFPILFISKIVYNDTKLKD